MNLSTLGIIAGVEGSQHIGLAVFQPAVDDVAQVVATTGTLGGDHGAEGTSTGETGKEHVLVVT